MTKLARVICIIFIISFSFVFTFEVSAGFDVLLKPIPEDSQLSIVNYQLSISQPPSVTFGDLLNLESGSTIDSANDESQLAEKTAQLKKLLADLEASYASELAEFRSKTQYKTTDTSTSLSAGNRQPTTDNRLSPTPFIPIPTLIASVSDLAGLKPATDNRQPTTNYPTPTLTDTLLLATLKSNNIADSSIPQFPISNILGALTQNPPKTYYTVALLGDSMTDTLGRDLPHLRSLLQENFPGKTFSLLNYGFGATDMESWLYRLTDTSNYLGVDYPPLLSFKPDILVVESFAYNHWSAEKYDLDRQWVTIAKIADTVREKSPDTRIILAASIAPNKYIFGDGVLNWSKSLKENSSLIIKAYLQNLVNFATSEYYPLADAYHPSLDSRGNGLEQYISSYDHLHPSPEGAYLYSKKIVEAIKNNGLIN